MKKLISKRHFYQYLESNPLINTARTWTTLDEALRSDYNGTFNLRFKGAPGVECLAGIPRSELATVYNMQLTSPSKIQISEDPPNRMRTIQGEIIESPTLHLEYTFLQEKLDSALLKDRNIISGLSALHLLQCHLVPGSLNDIRWLLDAFPNHVIEFSAFSCLVGSIPRRNTIIWEIRYY
jgi:hypothetical protein